MAILKLIPACKDYLWGGTKLREKYNIKSDLTPLAEGWMLSTHKDGESVIANGEDKGLTLSAYIEKYGKMHEYYDGDTCEGVHNLGFQSWNLLAVNMYHYLLRA